MSTNHPVTSLVYMHSDETSQYCGLLEMPVPSQSIAVYNQETPGIVHVLPMDDGKESLASILCGRNNGTITAMGEMDISSSGDLVFVAGPNEQYHGEVLEPGIAYALMKKDGSSSILALAGLGSRRDCIMNYTPFVQVSPLVWRLSLPSTLIPNARYAFFLSQAVKISSHGLNIYVQYFSSDGQAVGHDMYEWKDMSGTAAVLLPNIVGCFVYTPGGYIDFYQKYLSEPSMIVDQLMGAAIPIV